MHELSLAQGLVEQVQQIAEREGSTRVQRIMVVIGPYSGVEADAFEFAFPFAAEGSPAEGAELVIEKLPVTVHCAQCGCDTHPEPTHLMCRTCGSNEVTLQGGREFSIRELELTVPG